MKKTTLLYCLLIFIGFSAKGQVYLVENIKNQIILSPENVDNIMPEVCLHHLATIADYETKTTTELDLFYLERDKISQESNSKRKRKQLNKKIENLEKEISILDDFRKKWLDVSDEESKSLMFYNEWQKDNCLSIVTKERTYLPDEYELKIATEEKTTGNFKESFAVKYTASKESWKKTKKRGCNPATNRDCYVWCAVELPEKVEFFDYSSTAQTIVRLPSWISI